MGFLRKILFGLYSILNKIVISLNGVKTDGIQINGLITIYNKGICEFEKDAVINSHSLKNIIGGDTRSSIVIKPGARLRIGKHFRMSNSAIYCAEEINIGDNVMIGGSCKIWDTDFHPLDPGERIRNPNEGFKTRPIGIGNNVFIGGFSIILKGVQIGDDAIVGAGSVVSKNIPSGEVWAGNPAAFVKKV